MYQSPQSLLDPVIAFVGTDAATVAAVLTLKLVDDEGLRLPPRGIDAELVANEVVDILAQNIDIWVPRQELRKSDGRMREDHRVATVGGLPGVGLTGCGRTEIGADRSIEVLAVQVQSVLIQEAVGRDVELLRDGDAGVGRLDGIGACAGRWIRGCCAGSGWDCSEACVKAIAGWSCICVSCCIAGRGQDGEIARQARIVPERIAQLELLRTKPAVRATFIQTHITLGLPFSELWIAVLPSRAVSTSVVLILFVSRRYTYLSCRTTGM